MAETLKHKSYVGCRQKPVVALEKKELIDVIRQVILSGRGTHDEWLAGQIATMLLKNYTITRKVGNNEEILQ
jgi:hypothetical protein